MMWYEFFFMRNLILCWLWPSATLAQMSQIFLENNVVRPTGWTLHTESPHVNSKVTVTVAIKQRNTATLEDELLAISSPDSPHYGKIWTLQQIESFTSPSQKSFDAVTNYLESFGIKNFHLSSGFVRAEVDVLTLEKVLSTKYRMYRHEETGQLTTRCLEYSLPAEIAQHVDFVSPTVNFPRPLTVKVSSSSVPFYQNTPDNLRSLYNLGDAFGGKSTARQGPCPSFL
jgi:subtilase family serine protease